MQMTHRSTSEAGIAETHQERSALDTKARYRPINQQSNIPEIARCKLSKFLVMPLRDQEHVHTSIRIWVHIMNCIPPPCSCQYPAFMISKIFRTKRAIALLRDLLECRPVFASACRMNIYHLPPRHFLVSFRIQEMHKETDFFRLEKMHFSAQDATLLQEFRDNRCPHPGNTHR